MQFMNGWDICMREYDPKRHLQKGEIYQKYVKIINLRVLQMKNRRKWYMEIG